MKKQIRYLALLLCLVMAFSLTGCGKSEYVKNAESLIDAIGEVTADSEEAVLAAEKAYDALTAEDQAKVDNAALLPQAREALDKALEEKAAAELEALRQSMIGTWRADIDFSKNLSDSVDKDSSSSIVISDYIGDVFVSFYLCLYDGGTYRCFYDEDSLKSALSSIRAGMIDYYAATMRETMITSLSAEDPDYDFTAEGALEAYIGMSLDEATKAITGMDINTTIDLLFGDAMVSTLLDSSNREGLYFVESGKLHLSNSIDQKPLDGNYESFTLEDNLLSLTSYSGTGVLGDVYPVTFVREG